jgi:hypothetical protein
MVAIRDFEMQPRTQAAAGFLALGECSRWLGYSCGARWQHRNTQFHSVVVIGFLSPRLDFPLPAYLPARLIVKMLPRAAEAYRAQVAKIRDVLQDENAVHRARVALRDMLDGPVKLSPSPEGKYLIAEIAYSPKSLLRAAGSDLWNGSGGMIRNYNHRNFHEIFFHHRCKPFPPKGLVTGYSL